VLVDSIARPTFRRLALRNISRRKGEALLVILGSLLGTAIITASFVVGDTIDDSLRDNARTRLGPIDVAVKVQGLDGLAELEATLADPPITRADGMATAVVASAAAATPGEDPRAEPSVSLTEIDFDDARGLGPDLDITGFAQAGATPEGDQAVINDRLADELDVGPGDPILVSAYGATETLVVRDVIDELGIAGYGGSGGLGFGPAGGAPVFVAPGTIERLYEGSTLAGAAPPSGQVLVSNRGRVFDSGDGTFDEVVRRTAALPAAEVAPLKQDLLDDAEDSGREISELYSGIGTFSVIAGILLLVNLFVMLAEERKTELGMLRAVGFKRNHITRSFAIEGAVYAVTASIAGAIVGIGVGWVITRVAARLIATDAPDLVFRLSVQPASLATGAAIGLVIALLTVWGTSVRIARLNIISAIRDLPEPRAAKQSLRSVLLGLLGFLVGAALLLGGITGDDPYGLLAGFAVAAFSLIPVLVRVVPRKPLVVVISTAVIAWSVLVFTLFPDAMNASDIPVFVLMGVVLVGAAVAIVSSIDHLWVALANRLSGSGRGLSARLGLAYPLARKFRTGMLLGMYAIVIFTMTFISVFTGIFNSQAATFADEVSAGYQVYVDSNPGNPLTVEQLEGHPGVTGVATLTQGLAEFTTDFEPVPSTWVVTGFDDRLLAEQAPALSARLPEYGSDEEVFEAVLADPSLVVVNDFFLQGEGGPPEQKSDPGDVITIVNPADRREHDLTVAGVTGSDFVFNGSLVGRPFLDGYLGPLAPPRRHYVEVTEGTDPDELAESLNAEFLANGADASTFRAEVDKELAQNEGFFNLMQGYLALGLLIGIAGLGVVMIRAVRERRREIGMLRAMGFPARVVRRAFLLEAAFVALQGSLIGIGLGLLTAYEVLVNSSTFGDQPLPFAVPWVALAVILVAPLLASLVATAAPATQAARIRPAAALRIAD
jgi:putative ABC transport system permease protein